MTVSWKSSNWKQPVSRSIGILLLGLTLISCANRTGSSQGSDAEFKEKVLKIIRENPEVILDSVREYQQRRGEEQRQNQQTFIQQMKTNPASLINNSPTLGNADRKIVLLMFSDFQCPYCAETHKVVQQFMGARKDRVTLVYKHLPLTSIHPEAMPAAKAAWAAGQQGKFWEFHDALFNNQERLGETLYQETAKALNLDLKKFDQDRNSEAAKTSIQQDVTMAEKIGVQGTPFLVMNGTPFNGEVRVEDLEQALAQVSGQKP